MNKSLVFGLVALLGINTAHAGCDYSIVLSDPGYGDGWNGGTVSVLVNGGVELSDITLVSGYGPESHSFNVETGDTISTDYTLGGWPYENHYSINDSDGQIVQATGYPSGTPVDLDNITVDCKDAVSVPLSNSAKALLAMLFAFGAFFMMHRRKLA